MSEKCIDLADRIMAATATAPNTSRASAIGDTLEWFDRNSDQVPGRTITESGIKTISDRTGVSPWAIKTVARELDHDVVPDPEPMPTNAEKLEVLIDDWREEIDPGVTLVEWLVERGVKAPGASDA